MKDFSLKYFNLLTNEFNGINLTAIRNFEDFHTKQILDSILPLNESSTFKSKIADKGLVVDVGFGGGFPILPLAYLNPGIKFVGIESKAKKVKTVTEIANLLGIKNVVFIHERLEKINFDIDCVIITKAMATVENFIKDICLSKLIPIYFYKAKNFYELEGNFINKINGFNTIDNQSMSLPDGSERVFFGIENKVPRGTSKGLVNLSELLKNEFTK